MKTVDDLISAIRDRWDDEDARLVYGDLLIERGDEHLGQLIAVQCALSSETVASAKRKLVRTQNRLLEKIAKSWGEDWNYKSGAIECNGVSPDRYKDKGTLACKFERGFLHGVVGATFLLRERAEWLKLHAPLLASVDAENRRVALPASELLAAFEELPRLRRLALSWVNPAVISGIATREVFSELRELSLRGYLGEERSELVAALGGSTVLNKLETLDLYQLGIDSVSDIEALSRGQFRPTSLLLNDNPIGEEGARVLAQGRTWERVETLGLYKGGLGPSGVKAIANSSVFSKLRSLDVRSNQIGVEGARALGHSKNLAQLQKLVLVGNTMRAAAIGGLAGPGLQSLNELNLQNTHLSDEALETLLDASNFCRGLKVLNLRSNKLTDDAAKQIAEASQLSGLAELNLKLNRSIGRSGIAALRSSPHLQQTLIIVGSQRLKPGR